MKRIKASRTITQTEKNALENLFYDIGRKQQEVNEYLGIIERALEDEDGVVADVLYSAEDGFSNFRDVLDRLEIEVEKEDE